MSTDLLSFFKKILLFGVFVVAFTATAGG